MIHHVKRATRFFIFWSLIAGAVLLTLIRFVSHQLDNYTAELESAISSMIEAPCKIGKIRINIYGVTPKLLLTNIDILQQGSSRSAIQFKEIRLGIDLWDALTDWDLFSSLRVTVVGAKLSIKRKADGSFSVIGLKSSDDRPLWLLQGGRYEMLQSEVIWQDEKRHAAVHRFSHVDIFIDNQLSSHQHRINVSMQLPDAFGDSLQLSLMFNENIFQSQNFNGRIYARGNKIALSEMATGDLPLGMLVGSGQTSFELWSEWTHSKMTDLVGFVEAEHTRLKLPDKPEWSLQRAVARFHWSRKENSWRLAVKDVFLDTGKIQWLESNFSLWVEGNEQQPMRKVALGIAHMDVAVLSRLLIESKQFPDEQLKKLAPKGKVSNLFVFVDSVNSHIAANGSFENIGFSAGGKLPKIENLSGTIYGSDRRGYLQLVSNDAKVLLPELFSVPVTLKTLQGKLQWLEQRDDWLLSASMIEMDLPGIQTRNRLKMRVPKHAEQKVFMDLQTALVNEPEVRQVKHYLPRLFMDKDLLEWLDNGLLSGEVTTGSGLFYGNLDDFPFTGRRGVFEVSFGVRKLGLAVDAQWPYITDIDANVLFFGESLEVNVKRGRINGAAVEHTVAKIPSLNDSDYVDVDGRINGSIGQSIGFLQQSPIAPKVLPILEMISAQGSNVIDVKMQLPLSAELPVKINGVAHLEKAQLTVLPADLPVENLQGDLKFNEQGIYGNDIRATALGFPIQIEIDNFPDYSTVKVAGKTDIAHLQQTVRSRWWEFAQGGFDYKLLFTIPSSDQQAAKLLFSSDLTGLALQLPQPLGKSAEQPAPLSVDLDFTDTKLMPVIMNYANQFKAAMELDTGQQSLYSGHFILGQGNPELLHYQGARVEINNERFSLTPWLELSNSGGENNQAPVTVINEVAVNTEHLFWGGQDYGNLDLQLKRKKGQWQGHFISQFGAGDIVYPEKSDNDAKISLDMLYIKLDSLLAINAVDEEISPLDFPLIKINSRQLLWRAVNLGALAIDTERLRDGMVFKRFMIKQKERSLSFFGSSWKLQNGRSVTDATGTLEMDDLGVFLSEMDITYDMKGTDAKIDFSSNWVGAPFQVSLSDLDAQVEVNLGEGRFLGVEPGIGRVLGVLDLGRLLQRLQLDFRDVYAEGLSYDSIRGTFRLADGYAKTSNLVIDAVPATITITGSTGLVTRDYDQIITVIPKTSAAIPIAGTIVKGVAALVAKTVTGSSGDGFFISSQYALKGKWGDAEIIPLHENDGLLQKAWLGITDFSWLGVKEEIKER